MSTLEQGSGPKYEVPFFIPGDSLGHIIDQELRKPNHLREGWKIIAGMFRDARKGKIDLPVETLLERQITRRAHLRWLAAGGAAAIAATRSRRVPTVYAEEEPNLFIPELQVIVYNPPSSEKEYFPLLKTIAKQRGLVALDEEGGPFDVYSVFHYLIEGGPIVNLREEWEEQVTNPVIRLSQEKFGIPDDRVEIDLADAGYCTYRSGAQIRYPRLKAGPWIADFSADPRFIDNPYYTVAKTAIFGMETAQIAGGVMIRPNPTKIKLPYQTAEVRVNVDFFADRNIPFSGEAPPNWGRTFFDKVIINGIEYQVAEDFGKPNLFLATRRQLNWAYFPATLEEAKIIQAQNLMPVDDSLFEEQALYRRVKNFKSDNVELIRTDYQLHAAA